MATYTSGTKYVFMSDEMKKELNEALNKLESMLFELRQVPNHYENKRLYVVTKTLYIQSLVTRIKDALEKDAQERELRLEYTKKMFLLNLP